MTFAAGGVKLLGLELVSSQCCLSVGGNVGQRDQPASTNKTLGAAAQNWPRAEPAVP